MKTTAQLKSEMLRDLIEATRRRTGDRSVYRHLAKYAGNPREFALKVLGFRWWSAQTEIGQALTRFDRVIVRSGNGVGKTHVAADLALWFLYTNRPAVVITTATTMDQVKKPLWQEIHARFHHARVPLPGKLLETSLRLDDGSYAIGLATRKGTRGVSFNGHHCANLLVIIDEASGVPDEIWEAAAGLAVGRNNKILALGNPLRCSGRFYELFKGARGWHKITLNALHHPNVTGKGTHIPGAIDSTWIDQQIAEWCEEQRADTEAVLSLSPGLPVSLSPAADTVTWRERTYKITDPFRIRVLGEFPRSDEESLIPLAWIEAAQQRTLPSNGPKRLAVDVARFGDDHTIIGLRQGPVVQQLWPIKGMDTTGVARQVEGLAYRHHPETIAIDAVGIGAGVVDELNRRDIAGLLPMNGAEAANNRERFANRRAELYWGLRERFFHGDIQLPNDPLLAEELAQIRYIYTSSSKIQIEAKEALKRRLGRSPDRADMLAMLFYADWDDQSEIRNPQLGAPLSYAPKWRVGKRNKARLATASRAPNLFSTRARQNPNTG